MTRIRKRGRPLALSPEQVANARWYYEYTSLSIERIAKRFGVTGPTLSRYLFPTKGAPRMPNPIMKHFAYAHLPPHLQAISRPIGQLAEELDGTLPDSAEKSAGLRKLLEAKDCFVRAALGDG